MAAITINHFENGLIEFDTQQEFINFVQNLFRENEEYNARLSFEEAVVYLNGYCDNFSTV